MIFLNNLSKTYGQRTLFKNFSLTIDRGERIGLVGPNGAGKSTLFGLITKAIEPSSGTIQINKGVRIGYLPQEVIFDSKATVLSELIEGNQEIKQLKVKKDRLEGENKAGSAAYGKVLQDLEFLGYFDIEHRAKKILAGLGFKQSEFSKSINQMSGGFKMRLELAKLLTFHYQILLLDEPTNFLDLEAALWFKDYLLKFKGTFVMISHDRDFLTEVTNYTLVLEDGLVSKIKGNYETYEKMQSQRREYLLKQFKEQDKKRKQLETFISRFHAQPNKASQVRAKKRVLEKMEPIVVPGDRRESIRKFHFPKTKRSGYKVIGLEGITKSYGDISVYKNFDFELTQGQRGIFIGSNGAGKSTLLKILAGVLDIDSGKRILGQNVDVGYFSQTRLEVLNPHNTVLEEAYSVPTGDLKGDEIRTILAAFFFTGDDVNKKVSILSGGEKSRLILAKLLINPPNFLLLDEPTTHLDVDAVEALIKALSHYDGTLVFISHDIHFVRSVANMVFEIKQGNLRKFPGNFDYYWQKARFTDVVETRSKEPKPDRKQTEISKSEKGKEKKAHNAAISKEIKLLRKEKEKLEIELNVKKRIIANPRSYHRKEVVLNYQQRLKQIKQRLSQIDQEIEIFKTLFR